MGHLPANVIMAIQVTFRPIAGSPKILYITENVQHYMLASIQHDSLRPDFCKYATHGIYKMGKYYSRSPKTTLEETQRAFYLM